MGHVPRSISVQIRGSLTRTMLPGNHAFGGGILFLPVIFFKGMAAVQ